MSGSREKTQDDIDLETLIDLFDTALTSNNPAMKKAIKNLLLVATLIDSELTPEQRVRGPLRQALNDMRDLTRRMDRIESEQSQRGLWQVPINPAPMPGTPYMPGPTWIGPNTGPYNNPGVGPITTVNPPQWPNGTINCKTTSVSTTAFDDQFRAEELLTKLETK